MARIELAPLNLPEFGLPTVQPVIPAAVYEARIEAARQRAEAVGLDALVVYGDREHFANLAYLTGYDPRFEEALLILVPNREPTLIVGVEGWTYATISPVRLQRVLYPTFSLMGMPREQNLDLRQLLLDAGLREGQRIGVVGWKYVEATESASPERWIEVPAFIADTLRQVAGDSGRVVNATRLFMNPADGLRTVNDVDQLAAFEFASTFTSQALRNVMFGLRPGMTEIEATRLMDLPGLPLTVHPMLSSGPHTSFGLASPGLHVIEQGDPFMMAVGIWGALNCRAGFVVHDASELPPAIADYLDRLVIPYFQAAVAWYETVGLGVTGGALYDAAMRHVGDPFFGVKLNPGHLIHLDEWVHSPVTKGSTLPLRSGMAFQVDIIPATGTPYFMSNIEDGIALADETLRAQLAEAYPEAWSRIQARREFMQSALGIRLKPEILPFSNIPAYLTPYLLSPTMALRVVA